MPKVCVIPGDGVGPEVINSALEVLRNLDVQLDFESAIVGAQSFEKYGVYIALVYGRIRRYTWRF